MADYQSVLTRAVAKLPGASSAATRRAIYDRAREAMLTHLRALHPSIPESDITREEAALNQAIALVEAKFDGTEAVPAELTAAKPAPSAAGHPDRVEAGASPRPAQLGQPTNLASVPSSFAQSAPAAPLLRGPPTAPPSPVLHHLPAARPPSASSNLAKVVPPADAHARRSLAVAVSIVLSLAGAAVVMRQNAQGLVIAPLEHGREMSPQAPAKMTQRAQPSPTVDGSTAPVASEPQGSQSFAQSGRETSQPAPGADGSTAPPANEAQGSQSVAQSGRETPQPAAEVDGSAAAPANEAQGSQSAAQSGQETSQPAPKADGSTAPVASEPQGSQSVAQSGQETSQPAPKADNGTLPDAARAAMVIASQDDPQNQVVVLGSTVWSIIPPSPGQPSTVAVKADADIPDLKMHASMTLRKNTDPTLQATHTIDLNFALADGAPITGFKDVAPPLMHEPDTPTSEPLTSVKVKVSDVHFLIALANGDQDAPRNFELMQTRSWFEFPLLLNDDRIAKLAFQKSSDGVAMLGKAFDAWK
jgi:hypothetical protein